MIEQTSPQPTFLLSPRAIRLANLLAVALAVLMLLSTGANLGNGADDSAQYRQASRNLLRTGDPYATTPSPGPLEPANPNPPLLAYLLVPLAPLPQPAFRLVWYLINCACLLALLALSLRLLADPALSRFWGVIFAGFVFAPPTYLCLALGQLGIMLALLAVTSFALASRHPGKAGAALAFGAALKLYPAFIGLYVLVRGPRRVLWWAAAFGGFFLAIPALLSGLAPYESYLRKVLLGGYYPYPAAFNISLRGLWDRLFTANPYAGPWVDLPVLATGATLLSAALVVGLCLWVRAAPDHLGRLIVFAFWLCALQLLTPLNGYYNLPALLLPCLVLIACLRRYPSLGTLRLLALAVALLYLPPGWSRGFPALDQALRVGPGLLLQAPSLYGVILMALLLLRLARLHCKNSLTR